MNSKSEEIVKRIQASIVPWKDNIIEKRMFGGNCFLYQGKMCVGETKERLMVRVISEKGFDTEEKLQQWVELGMEHALLKSNS